MKQSQIDILADFIMAEVPGEPSRNEGAGDCAVRVIRELQRRIAELEAENRRLHERLETVQHSERLLWCSAKECEKRREEAEEAVRLASAALESYAGCLFIGPDPSVTDSRYRAFYQHPAVQRQRDERSLT